MTRDQRILGWRLVLLPLLLLLMALWQGHRADTSRTESLEVQSELQGFVLNMQQLQAEGSRQRIDIGGQSHSPALAEALAQRKLHQVDREVTIARIGGWLPGVSQGFAGLLLLLGAASLLALHWAGKAALHSRDRLVSLFYVGRQVLPTVLLALMLLLTVTVVLEIAYEALWLFTLEQSSSGVMKLQMLVGIVMIAMLWPLYRLPRQLKAMSQVFDNEPHAIFGTSLTEAQAPALWARVRGLATRLDALLPDHIVVGYLDGFYVTSSDVELSPSGQRLQGRTLYAPLPLLALLDAREADAVIGHELAHFSGQDTDYSIRFMPIYDGAWRSVGVLGERMEGGFLQGLLTMPAYGLAVHFMQCFDRAVSHWSRNRELLADATAARLEGAQAVVDSLVRTTALGAVVEACLDDWCQQPEAWPEDVLQALLHRLATQPPRLPEGELDTQLPHPSDTHPPTIQRIQALGLGLDAVYAGNGLRPVVPQAALATLEQALPGAPILARQLSVELGERLVQNRSELRQNLQARVEAVQARCVLHEGAQVRGRLVMAFSLAFGIGGLAVALWPHAPTAKPALLTFFHILGGTLFVLGVLFAAMGWRLVRRADTPALIFDAHTVRFANAPEPLPLHLIDGFRLLVGSGVGVQFKLDDEAPLPLFRKPRFFEPDAKFKPKTRMITVLLTGWRVDGKALKPQALAELVGKYVEGGHAHQALNALDQPVPAEASAAADAER